MAELRIEKRLIDYVGLNAKGLLESWLSLPKDIQLALVMLQGMGPDGAKLVNVDANGNLQVTPAGAGAATQALIVNVLGGLSAAVLDVRSSNLNGFGGMIVLPALYDGSASAKQPTAAGAVSMAAQSGLGVALVSPPGKWQVNHSPAAGTAASASRAAGGAGVRHVVAGYRIALSWTAALAGVSQVTINIRDGATGAGTILDSVNIMLPIGPNSPVVIAENNCEYIGSAATAFTIEATAGLANCLMSITERGYDVA